MVTLSDLFDMELFNEMRDAGFIKSQRHPLFPDDLAIVNYTTKAQVNYHWNEVTEQCRGLIYNPVTYGVIKRPFRKFYNYDEKQAPHIDSSENVRAFDKMDGSLGVVYYTPDGEMNVATRGSFSSDQAKWATAKLRTKTSRLLHKEGETDLFEIIYPDNRIVVGYDGFEGMVYLGTIINDTGQFQYVPDVWTGERSELMFEGQFKDLFKLPERENAEGFVVVTDDGRRVKVKYSEYVALHRIVSNLSEKSIWEMMGGPYIDIVEDFIPKLPEEHAEWAREVGNALVHRYVLLSTRVSEVYHQVKGLPTRKEQAMIIIKEPAPIAHALFAGLDGKSYVDTLWKALRPTHDDNKEDEVVNDD